MAKINPSYVQYIKDNYKADFTYAVLVSDFTAGFCDAKAWDELFAASEARYDAIMSVNE